MDIKEIKIVLDWAKSNIEIAKGSRHSDPDNWDRWHSIREAIQKKFDEACHKWVEENCSGK